MLTEGLASTRKIHVGRIARLTAEFGTLRVRIDPATVMST